LVFDKGTQPLPTYKYPDLTIILLSDQMLVTSDSQINLTPTAKEAFK
jgi:hypothetical protein